MLILLDIDGVMVPAKSWSNPPILEDGFAVFNSKSVDALNKILKESNARILLITSHRERFSVDSWINIFKRRGIHIKSLAKLPPNYRKLNRREEIINWYSTNQNIDNFVIIDDDKSLNDLPHSLKSRLISTKPLIGLNSSHIQDSIKILETPLELV